MRVLCLWGLVWIDAVLSIISGFAELLIPLAMVTTVFLRAVILYKADGQLKGEAT